MSTTETPTPLWPSPSAALVDVLDRQTGYDARVGRGFSNHLPMELVALDAMGAPPSRLEEMLAASVPRMDLRADTTAFDAYRAEIAADGIDATVRRHLPGFAEMPASEWFHSMIRLAYALDAGHPGQVASALADWTAYGHALPGEPPTGGDVPAIEVLGRLADAGLDRGQHGADLAAVASQDRFRQLGAPVVVRPDLDDLAAAVAAAHVSGASFASLHLVTGVQAARTVGRHLRGVDEERFARRVAQAALAGHVAGGAPPVPTSEELDRLRAAAVPPWDQVRAAATASPDVHVTKLVYTCRTEQAASGDPLYAWLAARAVGLVGSTG